MIKKHIKLTYAQYEQFESELNPSYFGTRPISMKVKAAGVIPSITKLYITDNNGIGVILSNESLENEPLDKGPEYLFLNTDHLTPEKHEGLLQKLREDTLRAPIQFTEPEVNVKEALNIFNELLEAWQGEAVCVIENCSGSITEEREMVELKKEVYIKRFKKALGVSDHEGGN